MEKDLETPLISHQKFLQTRIIHEKIGSLAEHITRLTKLVDQGFVFEQDPSTIKDVLAIMKCDIETLMVHEYPSLQGYIGTLYAHKQSLKPTTAVAIQEHYLPLGPKSPMPASPLGASCALLDKLLTLVTFIAVDRKPSSSKDPFGVRRMALGIIRILEAYPWNISLHAFITACTRVSECEEQKDSILAFLHTFFRERIAHYAKTKYPLPVIHAATHKAFETTWDIRHAFKIMETLHTCTHLPALIQAYKRASNLAGSSSDYTLYTPEASYDKDLYKALNTYTHTSDMKECLNRLCALSQAIESFCDQAFVASDNPQERTLRQSMLTYACTLYNRIAHFNALTG